MYRRDNPQSSSVRRPSAPVQNGRRTQELRSNSADQRARAYDNTRTQPAVRPGGNTEQLRRVNAERTAELRRVQGSNTATIPAQRRGTAPVQNRPTVRNERTGSVPYINNNVQRQRRPVKRRKAPLYIRALAWLYHHRKAALACACILLFVCVAVPLAVYAASNDTGSAEADFEILSTDPVGDNIISADPSGGAFDVSPIPTDKESSDVSSEPEAEDDTATDDTSTEDATSEPDDSEETSSDTAESEDSADTSADEPVAIDPEETTPQFYVTIGFYDREPITCLTGPATLREILYNAECTLRDTDRPTVSLDEMIEGESWIMIDSVTYETVTVSEAIPFEVETVEVQTVPRGTTQTATAGVYGSREKVYTVQYVNGAEVERTFEYEYVSSYPQNQVNYYGTGGTLYAPDGTAYSYSYYINVRATYYNIHGNTASGLPTSNSVMAVDPSVIPLGTSVYVMSDAYDMGVKIAADTGGAVKGNIIDIWMDENHPHYYEFAAQGVCNMVAYILD